LRAEHSLPKLKKEIWTGEPPLAESIQVAMQPPPPPPFEPGAPSPAPVKIELPAPTPEPKIDLPPVPIPEPKPAPMKLDGPFLPAPSVAAPSVPAPMAPLPMAPPITAVEAVVPVVPVQEEPSIFLGRANLGDTPMIRNWNTLALYSLLARAPVAAPTPVVAGGGLDEKTQKRIDGMLSSIDEAIKALNKATDGIGELRKDIRATQTDMENLKTAAVRLRADVDGSAGRIDDLQKLINNLDAEVKHLRKRLNDSSFSPPPSADKASLDELKRQLASIEQAIRNLRPAEPTARVALSPPAATGKVILANMYNEELLFVINQKQHRVPPGAVVSIESVPAGNLLYEVISPTWGQRARNTTSLPANETFTLTAR
jgi:polyhydroxyalkanoate synthesis regulator phasin